MFSFFKTIKDIKDRLTVLEQKIEALFTSKDKNEAPATQPEPATDAVKNKEAS